MTWCKYIAIAFFTLLTYVVSGQEVEVIKSDSTLKVDGRVYIIHPVTPKQTLFSIAKTYEVKLSRIAFDNPGVLDGLKLGQHLMILESAVGETRLEDEEQDNLELDGEYVLYTVPKKQTLYSISKEFNTTIGEILDVNPELADGLKVGSTIRIPVPKMLDNEEEQRVEMEGMPDILRIEKKVFEWDSVVQNAVSEPASVALMLPLYLTMNDTLMARKLEEEPELIYERSEVGLAFYEGFLLALDSITRSGHEVEVKVFDTENDEEVVSSLVRSGKLDDFDLIIGPLYGSVFKVVAQHAYKNCIPLVSPTLSKTAGAEQNDFVIRLIPSEQEMVKSMGQFLALSDSTENIILHYGVPSEIALIDEFYSGISTNPLVQVGFKEFNLNELESDSLRNALSLTGRTNLIILSNNEVRLASLLRNMSDWLEEAYVVGFALNSWKKFQNIEMDYFDKYRIHLPSEFYVDYDGEAVQLFVKDFREKYNTEPSTFAFRGYDLGLHFLRNLDGIRSFGIDYLTYVQETGLQNDFLWKRMPNGGLENTAVNMLDYTNFELKVAVD
jgi:LysM repeat protein/ABC-type branched-subunit amino acid transport system substrate-binding protein